MDSRASAGIRAWLRTPNGLVLLGFLVIAAYFLLTEHRAHVLGALPYVLLLLCPLLYLFLHRGHDGHGKSQEPSQGDRS